MNPRRLPLLPVALTALGVLALQVSLTRVYSLLVWYHFAFLAVALALLGFTAGGVLVQLRPALREGDADARAAKLCTGAAASVALCLAVATRLPFGPSVLASAGDLACFVALMGLSLVPFVLAGVVLAAALAAWGARASVVYAADLAGSALGCGLSVVALDHLGGGAGAMMFSALAFALAGLASALRSPSWRRVGAPLGAAVAALCAVLAWQCRDPLHGPFYLPNAKLFPRVPKARIVSRRCDATACVDLFRNPEHHGLWGLSPRYDQPLPAQVGVVIDAWALTSIFEARRGDDGRPELRHPIFEMLLPSFAHLVDRARGFHPRRMLVIGAGGGVDVRAALHFGVPRVEAVEINRNIVRAVAEDFAGFAGDLYQHPAVTVHRAEGRHHLRRARDRYDLLQVSGVDTYAASQAGAFALSENFLYTVEAFGEYLEHLTPDGTLTLTRWLYEPPRHTLRLAVMADEAWRRAGLGDVGPRMVILSAGVPGAPISLSLVLLRRAPFDAVELRRIRLLAAANGFGVVWSPDTTTTSNAFERYFRAPDRAAFVRDYHYRIDPSTDDSPFFFEYNRFLRLGSSREAVFGAASGQALLVVTLLLTLVGGALGLFALPRLLARGRAAASLTRGETVTFLALGLGYIGAESVLVPRFTLFLGSPSHALSVVLLAMLGWSGLGSALSARVVARSPARLAGVALGACAALVAVAASSQAVFHAALAWPLAARVAVSAALLAVPATLMGMPFPQSLAALSARAGDGGDALSARAWVLNGWASVVGSVAAMVAAIAWGFTAVLAAAGGCYVAVALAAWARARRPSV